MPGFRHSDTERLYDYWRSLADGNLPHYRLWDPIKIPKLMPFITILELDEGDDFVHRFAGTGTCEFVGVELTGRLLKEFFSSPEEFVSSDQHLRAMLGVPCGRQSVYVVRSASGHECLAELLTLPLGGEGGVADRLIVYMTILETHGFGKSIPEVSQHVDADWIDLGFGVPEVPFVGAAVQ